LATKENAHNADGGPIDRVRIGTAIMGGKKTLCTASSSGWPTLKIYPIDNKLKNNDQEKNMVISRENSYLLDFNQGTLIYAKRQVQKGPFGFLKRISGLGKADINVQVQFNVNSENVQLWEKESPDIRKMEISAQKIFTRLITSAQRDMAIVLHPEEQGQLTYFIIRNDSTNKKDIHNGSFKPEFGDNTWIQKTYLLRTKAPLASEETQAHLIIVANSGIAIVKIKYSAKIQSSSLEDIVIHKSIPDTTQPLNIQASCTNDNKLFIIHQEKNGVRKLLAIDIDELTK
jgi:hypothetical protein